MNIEQYRKKIEQDVSESTIRSRTSAQRNLQEFIGGGEPTVEDVEKWVDHLIEDSSVKNSTIREYFKAVDYYFKVVKREPDALDHIWLPTGRSDSGDFLEKEEWERLLTNISKTRDKAVYSLMYKYARRPSEILYLNKEDIDYEEGTIRFLILKKTSPDLPKIVIDGEERGMFRVTFELDGDIEKILRKADRFMPNMTDTITIDGEEIEVEPFFTTSQGRLSYDSIYKSIKEAADRAGIEKNVTPKTMRHSRATHLDWEGNAPGNIARDMLIHEPDSQVIGSYIHDRSEDEVREVMGNE